MKILVTGGAGFIGSNLVRLLIGHGHEVINVDMLTYAGNLQSLIDLHHNPKHLFVKADICDTSSMLSIFLQHHPDWVIHLAAESHVDRSICDPKIFIQTNVLGTFSLLEAARSYFESTTNNFCFFHVSTDEVFGSLGDKGFFTETTPYDPRSPYSASKAASDHLVRAWFHTFKLPVIISNCSNNYGPYQFPEKLIPSVISRALKNESIPVYGKGNNIRDWIYVIDHAEAIYEIMMKGNIGESYNIGSNNEIENIDLVRMICYLLDMSAPRADKKPYHDQIEFVEDRLGHDFRYAINAEKIKKETGWSPKHDLISGLKKTINWYVENPNWINSSSSITKSTHK